MERERDSEFEDSFGDKRISVQPMLSTAESEDGQNITAKTTRKTPSWAWLILFIAVLSMSSGGLWFALVVESPPILKAAWRLLLTSAFQVPLFIRDFIRADSSLKKRWLGHMWLMSLVGFSLAVHFAAWSWSVDHTSLTHSLLLVCAGPLLIVGWFGFRFFLGRYICVRYQKPPTSNYERLGNSEKFVGDESIEIDDLPTEVAPEFQDEKDEDTVGLTKPSERIRIDDSDYIHIPTPLSWLKSQLTCVGSLPPTWLEVLGCILGFLGSFLLITLPSGQGQPDNKVTLAGDMMALLGAAAIVFYLLIGGELRKWMPLFLYAFPVTAFSAIFSYIASFIFEEGVTFIGTGPTAVFGFFGTGFRFAMSIGAAFVSGILGHTFANLSLKFFTPLIISVSVLWEPLLGSLLGWVVGVQDAPGASTWVGAPFLLIGALFTTIGARDSGFDAYNFARRVTEKLGIRSDLVTQCLRKPGHHAAP
eukprot:Colp12_sorted_trinity150504_noHs@1556